FFKLRASIDPTLYLLPYTTPFRSNGRNRHFGVIADLPSGPSCPSVRPDRPGPGHYRPSRDGRWPMVDARRMRIDRQGRLGAALRSEEHTSELQSRENLVCRLLLEK